MKTILPWIGGALWLIGGNIVLMRHYRRRGMPWWSVFRPFDFPFFELSVVEWVAILALAIASMAFIAYGLS